MKLLMLGGTSFLGRHIVDLALERGHEVTLFNRGQRNPDLFPGLEKLRGDRSGDLRALEGRQWDAAVDTCGFIPRLVSDSATLLSEAIEHYTFISSISVYADTSQASIDESAAVGRLEDETVEEVTGETYGPLKALCEEAAEAAMPGRVLNVRPGLIVGPHDPSDRFTYWPVRAARGGEILAPKPAAAPVQIIDARDLAAWIVRMAENRTTGIFNATGPNYFLSMGQLMESCLRVSTGEARITWVDADFLLEAEVTPWMDIPLWLPEEEHGGFLAANIDKAVQAGLSFRPLADTIADTLAWAMAWPAGHSWRAGLEPDREKVLLASWRERSSRQ